MVPTRCTSLTSWASFTGTDRRCGRPGHPRLLARQGTASILDLKAKMPVMQMMDQERVQDAARGRLPVHPLDSQFDWFD